MVFSQYFKQNFIIFSYISFFIFNIFPSEAAILTNETLFIITEDKKLNFQIELADTEKKRQHGLMFRTNLPEKTGMLFDFKQDRVVQMWMKNTYISLDVLFIDENGIILHIAENQPPFSLTPISSRVKIRAALELITGSAKKMNIKVGNRVIYSIFDEKN